MIRSLLAICFLTGVGLIQSQEYLKPPEERAPSVRLNFAIFRGDLTAAESLLKQSPKLANEKEPGAIPHELPLLIAATYGNSSMVKLLLDNGADPNLRNWQGDTALHHAAGREVAKLLITRGGKVDIENQNKQTPLQSAAASGRLSVVAVLRENGAKLDFESAVRIGLLEEVTAMLGKEPWLAKRPSKTIFAAVDSGDPKIVELLLKHGADPSIDYGFSNVSGPFTPLSEAVIKGNYENAKLICDAGAITNVSGGRNHDNLLLYSLAFQEPRFAELLLTNGASTTITSHWGPKGLTALHVAAAQGGMKGVGGVYRLGEPNGDTSRREWAAAKVKAILSTKADPNATTGDEATPLHCALLASNHEVTKLLVEAGAKIDLYSACALGKVAEVEKFIKADSTLLGGKRHPLGWPPLHWAIVGGDLKTVDFLLSAGADPNALAPQIEHHPASGFYKADGREKNKSQGALLVAIRLGHLDVAKSLLKAGAKPDGSESDSDSPLCVACQGQNVEAVKLLLANKANPKLTRRGDSPPLAQALPNKELVEMLLEKGADVNVKVWDNSLLHYSLTMKDSKPVTDLLLARGAKIDFQAACLLNRVDLVRQFLDINPSLLNKRISKDQGPPLEIALEASAEDVVALLLEKKTTLKPANPELEGPLQIAASHGLLRSARSILLAGIDVNTPDNFHHQPFLVAANHGQSQMVKLLLEHGADPKVRDSSGDSSLHCSAKRAYWKGTTHAVTVDDRKTTALVLLKAGAKLDARNGRGEMPLHIAAEEGELDLVRLFIDNGAEVNARDWSDRTPLDHAKSSRAWRKEEGIDNTALITYLIERGAK